MFLNPLPPAERPAFLELARRLIRSDGVLAPEEVALMGQIKAELDLVEDPTDVLEDVPIDELLDVFDSKRSRAIVLLELLGRDSHPRAGLSVPARAPSRGWRSSRTPAAARPRPTPQAPASCGSPPIV